MFARAFISRDAAGAPARVSGVNRDLSEAKAEEERLRQAAAVFECTREGVAIADAAGRILRVNRAFTDITGYAEAEVLGATPALLGADRHDAAFYAQLRAELAASGYWKGEIWSRRKDGRAYPQLLSISAVPDAEGRAAEYIGVFSDLSQSKASTAHFEFLAHHDALTGLPNRLLLFDRLEHAIAKARRDGGRLALLMLDLDRFKDVNDGFGHAAGDELLRQVAARLRAGLRAADTVSRLGGDEFAVILAGLARPQDAAQVARKLIDAVSEPWRLSGGADVAVGASVGISFFPEYGQTAEVLLQQADSALYQAKGERRGHFRYYSEELTEAARARVDLEARLRRALAQGELRVHYQAQVEIASGRVVGAEALLRWEDPDEGLLPPGRFVPLAEQTGLIVGIGAWVLAEACRQGRLWQDLGLPPVNLAVNLSPRQLRQGDIAATLACALADSGFPRERLALELTESALSEREREAAEILGQLRALGVRLAIDDFGTGYSSLAYLKRFPLDMLKIDKRFVDDIALCQDDRDIAAAVIAMGHTLRLKVLAEGVETPAQLDFLRAQGCDLYQGHLHSPALPADQFAELLRRGGAPASG